MDELRKDLFTQRPSKSPGRIKKTWTDGPSVRAFIAGALFSIVTLCASEWVGAFSLGEVAKSVTNLVNIKKNLDSDIKLLTADAKKLMGSKDQLLQIKDRLLTLAKDTRTQVDTIQSLVGEVEAQLKQTEKNIATTSEHVGEIDKVRKALSGK